jgi:NAD(P)H-hydrate epimerase
MATGGTGDVLTGLVAGLLAQGLDALDAAVLAVYLHGLAGDLAAGRLGEMALAAGDLIEILPAAFAALKGEGEEDGHDHEHGAERGHGRHPHRR